MRNYELVTIVSPEVSDDDVKGTTDKVQNLITTKGGVVTRVQRWGKRKLAYPIKHHIEGHYILAYFDMDPQLTSELDADLKVSEEVIKHLMIRADVPPPELQDSAEEPAAAEVEDGGAAAEEPVAEAATQTEETTEPTTTEAATQTEETPEPTTTEAAAQTEETTEPTTTEAATQTEETPEPITAEADVQTEDAVEQSIGEPKTEAKDTVEPEPAEDEAQTEKPVESVTTEDSAEESDDTSNNDEQGDQK